MVISINQVCKMIHKTIKEQAQVSPISDYQPQISANKQMDLIRYIIRHGVSVSKVWTPINGLKKRSKNLISFYQFDKKKVEEIASGLILTTLMPIIISKDDYIIDGHHRVEAVKQKFGNDKLIPAFQIDLEMKDALELYIGAADFVGYDCGDWMPKPLEIQKPVEKKEDEKQKDDEMEEVKPDFSDDQEKGKK